jgi:hypothetical protein
MPDEDEIDRTFEHQLLAAVNALTERVEDYEGVIEQQAKRIRALEAEVMPREVKFTAAGSLAEKFTYDDVPTQ